MFHGKTLFFRKQVFIFRGEAFMHTSFLAGHAGVLFSLVRSCLTQFSLTFIESKLFVPRKLIKSLFTGEIDVFIDKLMV